jgi:uncharacterized protein
MSIDVLLIFGWLSAIIIGISLGLIGGGGSILTVPALVYLLGINPVMATAYSLFIVGLTSLVGAWNYHRKALVDIPTAVVFGIPSIVAVFLTRKYMVPALPESMFSVNGFEFTKSIFLMVLFALLMVAASVSMIRKNGKQEVPATPQPRGSYNYLLIVLEGIVVGGLTGLVGAGGGFLIIPALVLLSKLPMKTAIGTSLLIIAAKSLLGFVGDVFNYSIDWSFLGLFSLLSIAGIFLGGWISGYVSGEKLKPAFGWFVLGMGIYILSKEIFF